MHLRSKLMFCFSIVIIFNIGAYMHLTGTLKSFFTAPVQSDIRNVNDVGQDLSAEKVLSFLLHNTVEEHKLTRQNLTFLIDKFIRNEFEDEPHRFPFVPDEKDFLEPRIETQKYQEIKPALLDLRDNDVNNVIPRNENVKPAAPVQRVAINVYKAAPRSEKFKRPIVNLGAIDAIAKGRGVNPHDFNYLINEPAKCKNADGSNGDIFLLVLISSIHPNFENRNAVRQSWGSPMEFEGRRVVTMFMLAKRSDAELQGLMLQESEQYHDIIMEDFVDTYKNLTLKTMMGMKWMSSFCPQARYVMKTDDDMYVSYESIFKYLGRSPSVNFVTGMVIRGSPIRDPKSKWYMPRDLYPGGKYPPFCSGTGYILSGDVPPKVYGMSLSTPYLHLEDVFVAVCLDKLHIIPVNHKEFNNGRASYTYCRYKRILTSHMVTPTEMIRYWNDQKSNRFTCISDIRPR